MSSSKGRLVTRRDFLRMTGVGTVALVASACRESATPSTSGTSGTAASGAAAPGSSTQGGGTLKVVLFSPSVGKGDQATTDSFKAKHPGVNVEITPIQGADWEAFFSKILTNIAAGNVPDLTAVATEGTQLFAGKGLAQPLDDYVKKDQAELAEYFKDVHP